MSFILSLHIRISNKIGISEEYDLAGAKAKIIIIIMFNI